MLANGKTRIHETGFCAEVSKWADQFFATFDSPFSSSGIEGYGTGPQARKRKDFSLSDRSSGCLAICGEVRLPGTAKGHSAYDADLIENAFRKAENASVQYFFTWDVNRFVLWDRGKWNVPLLERRVREWRLGPPFLRDADEVGRLENLERIRTKFLPQLLIDLGRIYRGQLEDWPMPPDDVFIRSLESHLDWPITSTRTYLWKRSESSSEFDKRLQQWMLDQDWSIVRKDPERWSEALDRAAQSLVHILANRLIFYQALRARFSSLPRFQLKGAKTAAEAYAALERLFQKAVDASGDYEPLFYPHEQDWAGRLVFEGRGALDAWNAALKGIEGYDFKSISSDVVGRVFQRLVSPEERHRWGQHFTGDDVVDLINSFCVRKSSDTVLDPACGSGSFLVRAYYRKRWLDSRKPHLEVLGELFGCDIALYPAHLATLNLAAREINDEANYPRIARRDFFDLEPGEAFCEIPPHHTKMVLDGCDAVVGNPPYVRQERIESKEKVARVVMRRWPGLRLSGRSDLYCYFWPAAAKLLSEGTYFGFLTSSSWLDVEYGFQLQKWMLDNFKLVAVMESDAEPWFEDARVKTCVTILQRCSNAADRMATPVRFVKFKQPLAKLIGASPDRFAVRFRAVDALRDTVEQATADKEEDDFSIIVKRQSDLLAEGLRAGKVHSGAPGNGEWGEDGADYAGKWGRYLRAPAVYFEIMRNFGPRFVPLGEIAEVRRGITSGCDDFFMPRDITSESLQRFEAARDFKRKFGVDRDLAASGKIKIVRAGDGSEHPIEGEYLKPEVHSLMAVERPIVTAKDVDRFVLHVGKKEAELRGTWVARYLKYGKGATFDSTKSEPVTVPERTSCAARKPWYDLTKLVRPGDAFWPMAQQYRHVIAENPARLICNHNLFDLSARNGDPTGRRVIVAVLNSTLSALWKTFYGRFAGTEGNLKTEVVDVKLMEVPDFRNASPQVAGKILTAFDKLQTRLAGRLVEEQLMDCHSPERARKIADGPPQLPDELRQPDRRDLDDAIFELLGVGDPGERRKWVDRLYAATAEHFRRIRVVEIQKMEQRKKSKTRRFTVSELAADAWDAVYYKDEQPLARLVALWPEPRVEVRVPLEGEPRLVSRESMFDREVVFFGTTRDAARVVCSSRSQAELVKRLAEIGLRGELEVPRQADRCAEALAEINQKLADAQEEFEAVASSRAPDEKRRLEIVNLLRRWYIHGKPRSRVGEAYQDRDSSRGGHARA
ncbi:MAG: HsdM family class I SAM-dependent methyltransferase [Candidatus Binataceae bacterium]